MKYYLTVFAICIICITGVLSYANEIDSIILRINENNQPQAQESAFTGIIKRVKECK